MFGMTNLTNQTLHCMPWPEQVSLPTGRTTPLGRHDSATVIQVAGDPTGRLMRYAQQVLGSFAVGILDITVAAQDPEPTPFLQMDESYRLQVTAKGVELSSPGYWGALRGIATLAQLALHNQLHPGLLIQDKPRFVWRGLLLDVARHFFPLAALKSVIDGLRR